MGHVSGLTRRVSLPTFTQEQLFRTSRTDGKVLSEKLESHCLSRHVKYKCEPWTARDRNRPESSGVYETEIRSHDLTDGAKGRVGGPTRRRHEPGSFTTKEAKEGEEEGTTSVFCPKRGSRTVHGVRYDFGLTGPNVAS